MIYLNRIRLAVGRITSPVFVPLRRLIVWLDGKVGTCDHQLVLQQRSCFIELDLYQEPVEQISELNKKLSKDRANLEYAGLR